MIRRDYILRVIEEFFAALRRIQAKKAGRSWDDAEAEADREFQRLIGLGATGVARLSETELLAKLLQSDSALLMRQKTLLLVTLLNEAGDIAAAQERFFDSRNCYLKGLHLLLDVLGRGDADDAPEFVPRVEVFVAALEDSPLPLRTQGLLMQHYERTGQFARAEDVLYSMLDDPLHAGLIEFGIAFYERLKARSDEELEQGNLPRGELETGLWELRERMGKYSGKYRTP
jgi:hypothetical protein